MQIGVIGSAGPEEYPGKKPSNKIYGIAEKVGKYLAENGFVLVTGGKGGIMEAASRGAKKMGGLTVGIVKGNERKTSNRYVDVEIVTNTAGGGEESILISSCDALIVIGGGAGTLQEMAFAYRSKKLIIAITAVKGFGKSFAGRYMDARRLVKIRSAKNSKDAIKLLLKLIK